MTASDAREASLRVGLTVLVAVLSACSHESLDVGPEPIPAEFVAYLQSGEIGVFHQRDLVTLSGDLQETGRVTFDDLPPEANVVAAQLSADGHVAVLAWSSDPRWATYPDNGVSTADSLATSSLSAAISTSPARSPSASFSMARTSLPD